ncbi:ATP-binding protein [Xylophilus sp. GOD-11R]|nr:ATP-binding protein [Xylophilus sp. GOD-11R]WPB59436.1 ATP-binding protein [Xylophilus sp. GOD-11R]
MHSAPMAGVASGGDDFDEAIGLKNMQQLIQLRWIAVVGQVVTIGMAHFVFDIALPLRHMAAVIGFLAVFNLASQWRWRSRGEVTNDELFLALLVDVGMLTAQLYLSGGATNPFTFLYLLQVTLAAVLLQTWSIWTMVALTIACVAGLALFGRPLALPPDHNRGLASPFIQGLLICFALNAGLLVIFISRIGRNLRDRDAHLADLRQRAAEEEHVVRIGLLASGAAHELGTPLATLAVILGDWRRMKAFTQDAELLQEVVEMQAQVQRCKTILSGILLSAGEARGESSVQTTVITFLDEIASEWRDSRAVASFEFDNRLAHDLPMVSDTALKQMVYNVLDNALEASPGRVRLEASLDDSSLRLTVTDNGPGFTSEVLAQLGKPYNSTKGRAGGGLGLFLAVNVARTLGGRVHAGNRPMGGAVVHMTLPLAAITLKEGEGRVA